MADVDHRRVRAVFDAAMELPPGERAAYVARACGDDAASRARVQALLASAVDDTFLGAPSALPERPTVIHAALPAPGERIGPYELVRLLGEGGFGAVFEARQQVPVARVVALKVLKAGMDTAQVVARFDQERQALACLDHPGIARVLDAGVTASGRPFFVMELVDGLPLTAYCDTHRLPVDARLQLFTQICDAVQHAHGRGIIHRDLKPSNLLVAEFEGAPHVKVIDFGIAKAIGRKLTDHSLHTQEAQVIGTYEYMSPEQARGAADLDIRTDVWSLGVLLYELLTGATPFAGGPDDAFTLPSRIRDQEPQRPSTGLLRAGARDHRAPVAGARARRTRLDRDEGAREGARSSVRDRQRVGRRRAPPSGRGTDPRGPAECRLPAAQAGATPSRGGRRGRGGAAVAGRWRGRVRVAGRHRARPTRSCADRRRAGRADQAAVARRAAVGGRRHRRGSRSAGGRRDGACGRDARRRPARRAAGGRTGATHGDRGAAGHRRCGGQGPAARRACAGVGARCIPPTTRWWCGR